MVLRNGQIYGPRDLEACKHNLKMVGKLVGSHWATIITVGMSLYFGQHGVYAASNFYPILSCFKCQKYPKVSTLVPGCYKTRNSLYDSPVYLQCTNMSG